MVDKLCKLKEISLLLIIFLMSIATVQAAYWVANPVNCPHTDATNYPGQNCASPQHICGDSSGTAQCNSTTILPPGSTATSTTNQDAGNCQDGTCNGGYIINCYATADGTDPHCDNSGNAWCDRNSTCYTTQVRSTTCSANLFNLSVCGSCRSNYYNCYGDIKCEATSTSDCQAGTIPHTRYDTATCDDQSGGGSCECDPDYFPCDGGTPSNPTEDGDGCEHHAGDSCSSGTGTKVYNQCFDASNANCTSATNSDCDNDDTDGNLVTCNGANGCEIIGGGTCGSGTGTYEVHECVGANGNCTRISDYLDCNNDDSDGDETTCNGADGCEIDDGGACTVSGLPGTYDGCSGGTGNCVIDPQDIATTGQVVNWSGTASMLWLHQHGTGSVINASTSDNFTFIVNNSGAFWNHVALNITGGGGGDSKYGGTPFLYNDSTTIYFNSTYGNLTYVVWEYYNQTNETYISWGYLNMTNETYVTTTEDIATNTSMKTYVDGENTRFNNTIYPVINSRDSYWNETMRMFSNAMDLLYNNTMKAYADSMDLLFNNTIVAWANSVFAVKGSGNTTTEMIIAVNESDINLTFAYDLHWNNITGKNVFNSTTNTSITNAYTSQDTSYNDSMKTYVDGENTRFNNTIYPVIDSRDDYWNETMRVFSNAMDLLYNNSVVAWVLSLGYVGTEAYNTTTEMSHAINTSGINTSFGNITNTITEKLNISGATNNLQITYNSTCDCYQFSIV